MATFEYDVAVNMLFPEWREISWSGGSNYNIWFENFAGWESVTYDGHFEWSSMTTMYGTITSITDTQSGVVVGKITGMSVPYDSNDGYLGTGNYLYALYEILDGNDTIRVSDHGDLAHGYGGNDTILGMGGDDWLMGGIGSDSLDGGSGNDILNDELYYRDYYGFDAYSLYRALLGREPDLPGHDYWTKALYTGAISNLDAANGFMDSAEFQSIYGGTDNEQFVTLLYNNVLERDPDYGGLVFWGTSLNNGMSRAEVVQGFCLSPEWEDKALPQFGPYLTDARVGDYSWDVYRLYQAALDRAPDAGGLLWWSEELALGADKFTVTSGFLSSAEFQFKYGNTTDAEFVTLLYENVLGRQPEPGGFLFWTNALANGLNREAVVIGFADSAEFVEKTEQGVFDYMRSASATELSDTLTGAAGDDALVGGIGADTFHFLASETGTDRVGDLEAWDWVSFEGFGYIDADDVVAHMTQQSDGVQFADLGQTILFWDTQLGDFTEDTFLFA